MLHTDKQTNATKNITSFAKEETTQYRLYGGECTEISVEWLLVG